MKQAMANPAWHVVDAEGKTLGRLCTAIATLLQGKHKPVYVPNLLMGDYVVVVNADKIRVTGNKLQQKVYYRHSGYHGGLKEETLERLLQRAPTRAIKHAVKGMLPKNTIGRRALARLKLYAGSEHPHEAQVTFSNASEKTETASAEEKQRASTKTASADEKQPAIAETSPAGEKQKQQARPKAAAPVEAEAAPDEAQAQPDAADDPGTETASAGSE